MDTIYISEVRADWFVASLVMLDGRIYTGIANTKEKAIEQLQQDFFARQLTV